MKSSQVLRTLAVLLGAAIIIFVVYATPIIWRDPDIKWAVLIAWPLAIGAIRLLRIGFSGDSETLRRMDGRQAELRTHRDEYHKVSHGSP